METPDFVDQYLENIDATRTVGRRVRDIWAAYSSILPENPFTGVFISQRIDDEGVRRNGSLWFYGKNFAGESRDFLYKTELDGFHHPKIDYWKFSAEAYDFTEEVTAESRLQLRWDGQENFMGELSAVGDGCLHLMRYFREFVLPNASV